MGGGDGEEGAVGGVVVDGEFGGGEIAAPEFQSTDEVCALDGPGGFLGWVGAFLDLERGDFFHEEEHLIVRSG